jgi:hypothetical protein
MTGSQFEYPAVAGYYEFFVYLPAGASPAAAYAEESCMATLVSSNVMLTASHCTACNYTEDVGIAGFSSEVWVSFDVTATANDFRCFLVESAAQYAEYLTVEYACDVTQWTMRAPTFRKAAVTGRNDGVAVAQASAAGSIGARAMAYGASRGSVRPKSSGPMRSGLARASRRATRPCAAATPGRRSFSNAVEWPAASAPRKTTLACAASLNRRSRGPCPACGQAAERDPISDDESGQKRKVAPMATPLVVSSRSA